MAPRRDELLQQRFTLDGMLSEGFALLEERPGEELVLGTVGRFWRARGELCATSPVQFRAWFAFLKLHGRNVTH